MKKLLFLMVMSLSMVAVLIGCEKKDEKSKLSLSSTSVEMKFGEFKSLMVMNVGVGTSAVQWMSEDDFVATVDQSGNMKAEHIGTTNVVATVDGEHLSCAVTVVATYNSFVEPVVEWGASTSTVKSAEKRVLLEEQAGLITYKDPKIESIMYSFEGNKLTASAALVSLDFNVKELVTFLSERHTALGTSGDMSVWRSKDGKTGIVVSVERYGMLIMYIPSDSASAPALVSKFGMSSVLGDEARVTEVQTLLREVAK